MNNKRLDDINKKLNAIMCDYVVKVSGFCKSYEKEVMEKHYSSYSNTVATIYANFESELWKLKHEAEAAISEEISAAVNNYDSIDELVNLGKSFESDLFTMHKYYKYMYSGRIAEDLAKSWIKAGNDAFWDLTVNAIKNYVNKGGCKV